MGVVKIIKSIIILLLGIVLGICLDYFYQNQFIDKFNKKELNLEKTENHYRGNNEPLKKVEILEDNILKKGDRSSYDELSIAYLDRNTYEFLPYALLMANKYKYEQAYFDVYSCLFEIGCLDCKTAELEEWNIDKLDIETQKLAIKYLKIASEMGHSQATEILDLYIKSGKYGNISPPLARASRP